jgi:hypothetical protein
MSVATCPVCGTGFSARSDAVYCCSACRQKAHRARTAGRIAELSERAKQSFGPALPKRNTAASTQRVQDVVHRSRELCLTAAEHMQQAATIHERCRMDRLVSRAASGGTAAALPIHPTERALWRGN